MTGKVVEKVTCREKYERKGSKTLEENGFLSGSVRFSREEYEAGIHEKKPSMVRRLSGVGKTIALLDLGAKDNIADSLVKRGCDVTIYPASAKAEEIIEACPDGIMLSNGPGDPKECGAIIEEIKKNNAARCMISTEHLICTISIMRIPDDPEQEIRLFEELDKLSGVMKK